MPTKKNVIFTLQHKSEIKIRTWSQFESWAHPWLASCISGRVGSFQKQLGTVFVIEIVVYT